jgi:hypothetical protein
MRSFPSGDQFGLISSDPKVMRAGGPPDRGKDPNIFGSRFRVRNPDGSRFAIRRKSRPATKRERTRRRNDVTTSVEDFQFRLRGTFVIRQYTFVETEKNRAFPKTCASREIFHVRLLNRWAIIWPSRETSR